MKEKINMKKKNETEVSQERPMVERRTVKEFRETGLLVLVNQFLHIFGWALVVEVDDNGKVIDFFPAYCKFRGFSNETTMRAYQRVTKHIADRLPSLLKDIER